MSQIPTGVYQIVTQDGMVLNRGPVEDLSLRPKPLYLLPPSMAGMAMGRPLSLENKNDDSYVLRASGSDVGYDQRMNTLAAALIPDAGVTRGKVTLKEAGEGSYKMQIDGKWICRGEEANFGFAASGGSEGDAVPFHIVPMAY